MRLFEAKDLTKKYDKTVLNHLDFSIDEGEVVGIIGVSGCGKSTLARLVSGIEKPSSGSLLYQGKTVDFKKSRKDIQLILQNPIESFSPRMKIKQFLYEPYHYFYHLNKKEVMTAIKKILEQVGMDEACLGKYPHELSGGQLQRIAIARALIVKPTLLICDEITSSLDQIVQDDIVCLLKQFVQNKDTSILFISHDLSLVQQFCKRVIVLKDGKIIEKGT
jgi:ABC-type dipeptide/oligopeptide/nickel transport system ATPase subunit